MNRLSKAPLTAPYGCGLRISATRAIQASVSNDCHLWYDSPARVGPRSGNGRESLFMSSTGQVRLMSLCFIFFLRLNLHLSWNLHLSGMLMRVPILLYSHATLNGICRTIGRQLAVLDGHPEEVYHVELIDPSAPPPDCIVDRQAFAGDDGDGGGHPLPPFETHVLAASSESLFVWSLQEGAVLQQADAPGTSGSTITQGGFREALGQVNHAIMWSTL